MKSAGQVFAEDISARFSRDKRRCLVQYGKLPNIVVSILLVIFTILIVSLHYDQLNDHSLYPHLRGNLGRGPIFLFFMYSIILWAYFYIISHWRKLRNAGKCAIEFDGINIRIVKNKYRISDIAIIKMRNDVFKGRTILVELVSGQIEEIQMVGFVYGLKKFFNP